MTIFGNAYRLQATYQPSGDRVDLKLPLDAILLYPVDAQPARVHPHSSTRRPTGKTWTAQEGSDSLAQQQAEGPMPELGYVMVAGEPGASHRHRRREAPAAHRSTAIVLIVLAACVGLIGLGLIVRGRGESVGPD